MKEHYRVKQDEKDRKLILTKLFVRMIHSDPLRTPSKEITVLIDSQTNEILKYEGNYDKFRKKCKINEDYLAFERSAKSVEVRQDLIDTDICIVNKEVLNHFTDNFDYQGLHGEYINTIKSSEIINDIIIAYEI